MQRLAATAALVATLLATLGAAPPIFGAGSAPEASQPASTPAVGATAGSSALSARGGWIRQTPPGRDVAAGYLVLSNRSASDVVVTGASSPQARVEVHEMRTVDGMMRMRPLPELVVPAGGDVALEPGGTHLMLFGVDATTTGVIMNIRLETADGRTHEVALPVLREAPGASPGTRTEHHGDSGAMHADQGDMR